MLDEREAFLRAIFDAPDDDTPRLIFADWLDEHGEDGLARLIRIAHEFRLAGDDAATRGYATAELFNHRRRIGVSNETANAIALAYPAQSIEVAADRLTATDFRAEAVARPEWFGATELRVSGGRITNAAPFETLFSAAATRRVTRLILVGVEDPILGSESDASGSVLNVMYEYRLRPVVTTAGVAALAAHRGAGRLTELDMRNNDLDNDAARALARSPFLDNLRSLRVMEGNRFRGRVWQLLVDRFGHDVLGGDAGDEFPE